MRSFLLLAVSIMAVPTGAQAAGGLRRLRQQSSENDAGVVDKQYLGLANEVNGQAMSRVLRQKNDRVRKMIGFGQVSPKVDESGRERLYDSWGAGQDSAAQEEPAQNTEDEWLVEEEEEQEKQFSLIEDDHKVGPVSGAPIDTTLSMSMGDVGTRNDLMSMSM